MFDFDEIIDRRGTHCSKWDMMQPLYGVSPDDGLAMWVADMDFRPPPEVDRRARRPRSTHGVFGYFGDDRAYKAAIRGWMAPPPRLGGRPRRDRHHPRHRRRPRASACRPSPSPATA